MSTIRNTSVFHMPPSGERRKAGGDGGTTLPHRLAAHNMCLPLGTESTAVPAPEIMRLALIGVKPVREPVRRYAASTPWARWSVASNPWSLLCDTKEPKARPS